jgi:hypothetical protein
MGLSLPMAAFAQGQGGQQQGMSGGMQQGGMQQGSQQGGMQQGGQQSAGIPLGQGNSNSQFDRDASATGLVQGIVSNVNWQAGLVTVMSGYNRITLHGTPTQLSSLKRGDNVSLPYNSYAGILWLTNQFGTQNAIGAEGTIGGVPANLGFAQTGVMAGVVENVNKAEGLVFVTGANGRARFLAHPEVIEQLVPGEYVNLSYIQVGRVPWLSSIRLFAPGQQGAGQGGSPQPGGLSTGGGQGGAGQSQ